MLIPSSWYFVDLWLEEEQSVQSGQTMEQILWVPGIKYSEHSERWNMVRLRASYKKMEQIGFYDTTTHLVPLIWEGSGHAKFDLQELFWKDCWGPTVTLWMMNHSVHWWLKLSLSLTQDHSLETISDSKSEIPLSPSNLLMMKRSVVMPPQGEFSKADAYSKKRWQHVQHIAGKFWSRWRNNFSRVYK